MQTPLSKFLLGFLVGGTVAVAICLLLFLANDPSTAFNNQEYDKLRVEYDSIIFLNGEIDMAAKKKERHYAKVVDSLKNEINKKPTIVYLRKEANEKVNTSTYLYTDKQLDSVLTNYRYQP